jgi:hypothetical protein
VLEDVIGKKVVFRNGWDPTSTFLMLNYRDEGDGALLQRDYLRQTIPVEEEKMHHGHADENSICLLMSGGSVLLHDGGYRDDLPSGKWGAYRADYFHNRVVARKNKRAAGQDLFEFIRNSGANRKVQTQKIDFINFKDVDVSRPACVDAELGYEWTAPSRMSRLVTSLSWSTVFVFELPTTTPSRISGTRGKSSRGKQFFSTAIDAIGSETLPAARSLLVVFPKMRRRRLEAILRNGTTGRDSAVPDRVEPLCSRGLGVFCHGSCAASKSENSGTVAGGFRLLKADRFPRAMGVEFQDGNSKAVVLVKLDLEMDLAGGNIRPRYVYDLGRVRCGELETDASYAYTRQNGERVRYSAATFTRLSYRGQTLIEAQPTTFPLQLDGAPPRVGLPKWRFWEDEVAVRN